MDGRQRLLKAERSYTHQRKISLNNTKIKPVAHSNILVTHRVWGKGSFSPPIAPRLDCEFHLNWLRNVNMRGTRVEARHVTTGHCSPRRQWIFVRSPLRSSDHWGRLPNRARTPSSRARDNTGEHEQADMQSQALVICITRNNQLGSAAAIKSNTKSQHSWTQTTTHFVEQTAHISLHSINSSQFSITRFHNQCRTVLIT